MEVILRTDTDVELIGPWDLNDPEFCDRLQDVQPSVVVIADESLQSETATRLTTAILERYPELFVIRTGLSENVVRIFSIHTVPARGADLLETIRTCVTRLQDAQQFDDLHK